MALPHALKPTFFAVLLGLGGCVAGPQQFLKSGYVAPRLVAVLPMDNHTTDLNGPDVVRFWFDQRIAEKKGYTTIPLEQIDGALEAMGIRDGGQLPAVKPEVLAEKLGVDALIYGDLLDFNYQTTGFLNIRKVRAHFRMVDARTGELLWESEGLGANSEGGISGAAALQAAGKALGTQLAEKSMNSPLRTETWDMIWNAIEFLPAVAQTNGLTELRVNRPSPAKRF